ncbi:MAG: NAD-dependent epimerase/dehydratase family protein [Planctomycetota bacterium]|nr:MAG: NAD-dependent epimerase/dehydratase family protein [Planctomycetota bacterium]
MTGARESVIVTGGAGFIGANLVGEILRRDPGAHLLVIDDLRSGSFSNVVDACRRIARSPYTGELIAQDAGALDWDELLDAAEPRAVFHLAAITDTTVSDERTMIETNAEGFAPILHACAQAGVPLVYASSAAVYGAPAQARDRAPFPEDAAGEPANVYGFSKWLMENQHRALTEACARTGAPTPHVVGLRYFNVFGPGEGCKGKMASMARQLAGQILAGGRPRLFADGEQARDQTPVMDAVRCTLAAAEPGARPGVYNCGSGKATTFNALAGAVRAGLGTTDADAPTEYFEMPAAVRRFYQDFTLADLTSTADGLGVRPQRDPLEAIAEYASSLKSLWERTGSLDSPP